MEQLSLAGVWKLRPEFLDLGPERFNEVLSRPEGTFEILGPRRGKVYTKPFPKREGFLPAPVPCDVATALVEGGIIPEPLEQDNTEGLLWLMDFGWWFIRDFEVSAELFACEQVRLFIEILDFKADIILNGIPAFKHRNAFVPFDEDVKRYLRPGKNQIIIRLSGGIEDSYDAADTMSYYSVNGIRNQRTYMRKPAYTFGWDWCRPLPTCGIGRSIRLEGLSGAKISAFRADTLSVEGGRARLRLHFELDNISVVSADEVKLRYALEFEGKPVCQGERELYLPGGRNFYEEEIEVPQAKLWWPNGYGAPHLYTLKASAECRGSLNQMEDKSIGIRTIALDHSPRPDGTRNFRVLVNGVAVYCKGGNWVPTDSIYMRTPPEKYRVLVEEAKAQHFTMLRMWGGGVYEPDCFYEYCSRNGILLMHDFMYACAYYPDYLDAFLYEAEREARYQARRLAHHACMAIWTGNNEIHESYTDWFSPETDPAYYYGYKIFNYIQPQAVRDHAPLIPYMPCSPFFGKTANDPAAGDVHAWKLIDRLVNPERKPLHEMMGKPRSYETLDQLAALVRFSSEYGYHGPLMRSSVERHHAGEPVSFNSVSWKHHEGIPGFFYKETFLKQQVGHNLVPPETLDEDGYLLYAGILQGINYREFMEALRRQEHSSGGLIWMYNDCWPETGWTTVDYYLTRKISFYFLKRAFAPRKLIIRVFEGMAHITVLNESPEELSLTLEYGYQSFDGQIAELQSRVLSLGKHSFTALPPFAAPSNLKEGFYFVRAPGCQDFDTATSLRGRYRAYRFPSFKAAILSSEREGEDLLVTVKAETYVPVACLVCDDDRTHLSDNFFELIPGEEKRIRVYGASAVPRLHLVKIVEE
jgi:beta-mannosidase